MSGAGEKGQRGVSHPACRPASATQHADAAKAAPPEAGEKGQNEEASGFIFPVGEFAEGGLRQFPA